MNEHNNTITKPQAKKQRFLKLSHKFPEEKQQLVEEKDADDINIRMSVCLDLFAEETLRKRPLSLCILGGRLREVRLKITWRLMTRQKT